MFIGQNMAAGHISWESAVRGWYSELKNFDWSSKNNNWEAVAHYTQVGANF